MSRFAVWWTLKQGSIRLTSTALIRSLASRCSDFLIIIYNLVRSIELQDDGKEAPRLDERFFTAKFHRIQPNASGTSLPRQS